MTEKYYALYKGEDILIIGTIKEIAEKLGIKEESVKFYATPTYKKRTTENARRLVSLND
ncbi:hypothetical protein E4P35_13075 [Thiopseudomonas sp. 4R-3cl]|nr:hypothetical protein E4P35_13075 [Thiopseudomonas sp. 4R-3cl]